MYSGRVSLFRILIFLLVLDCAFPHSSQALRIMQSRHNAGLEQQLAAGMEEWWELGILETLADRYDIPLDRLREQLPKEDLHVFRAALDPARLEQAVQLYARVVGAPQIPSYQARQTADDLNRYRQKEPASGQAFPSVVPEEAFGELSRDRTKSDLEQTGVSYLEMAVRDALAEVPPSSPQAVMLKRLVEGEYSGLQEKIIGDAAYRMAAYFNPETVSSREIRADADRLISGTHPVSVRHTFQATLAGMGELEEPFQDESFLPFLQQFRTSLELSSRAGVYFSRFPDGTMDVAVSSSLPSDSPSLFGGSAAHEYAHLKLSQMKDHQAAGRSRAQVWGSPAGSLSSNEDWVASAAGAVMGEWTMRDHGGRPALPQTGFSGLGPELVKWLYRHGQELAGQPSERWLEALQELDQYHPQGKWYAQGILIGGIALGLGRQAAKDKAGEEPYQLALRFLGTYARQPFAAPGRPLRYNGLAEAGEAFRKKHNLSAATAGLEQAPVAAAAKPSLRGLLSWSLGNLRSLAGEVAPGSVLDLGALSPELEEAAREAGYDRILMMVGGAGMPMRQMAEPPKVYVQPAWDPVVWERLAPAIEKGLIRYASVMEDADLVIGDWTLEALPHQAFLQVDAQTAQKVTPLLIFQLADQDLLKPGKVLVVGMLVQGDFGEALLLFV